MTLAQGVDRYNNFRCETGLYPTRWFISAGAWRQFCSEQDSHNEFLGMPVYKVIEDGIFECH